MGNINLTEENTFVSKQVDNTQSISTENVVLSKYLNNIQHISNEHVIVQNWPTNIAQFSQMFVVVAMGAAAQLTLNKTVIPANDSGKFNLLVDGVIRASNVGNRGTSGPFTVTPGTHVVSEVAGDGTSLDDYQVIIGKAANPDGTITVQSGDVKSVVITNINKAAFAATETASDWEFWSILNPDIVQVLPIARRFDQLGPEELFRYGKIKQFEYRVLPFGDTIPYTIYFNDNTSYSNSLTTISGKEKAYLIDVPKGTSGSIVRIVFGPTLFDFHRYYIRMKCAKFGRDTELKWVKLPK